MAKSQRNLANIQVLVDGRLQLTPEFDEFNNTVRFASYGSARRTKLMELLERGLEFPVNCKHCPSLNKDPDLQKLLKEDKIELFNVRQYPTKYRVTFKKTHVRIKRK